MGNRLFELYGKYLTRIFAIKLDKAIKQR